MKNYIIYAIAMPALASLRLKHLHSLKSIYCWWYLFFNRKSSK